MTEDDIKSIEAVFGKVGAIPDTFVAWMTDQFALAVPSIPINQMFGARTIERLFDIKTDSLSVSGGTETEIYSVPLPGKTIAQNGLLKLKIPITLEDAAAAASATARVKLNGTTVHSQPMRAFLTTPDPEDLEVYLHNLNTYTSQVIETRWFFRRFASFASVDLSLDATLSVTFQFTGGDANDIFVRKGVFATLYNPSPPA